MMCSGAAGKTRALGLRGLRRVTLDVPGVGRPQGGVHPRNRDLPHDEEHDL